jgi:hypothetical protein
MEYGIFDPTCGEECLENGFYSRKAAYRAALIQYGDDARDMEIHEVCPDHPDYPQGSCPDCDEEA